MRTLPILLLLLSPQVVGAQSVQEREAQSTLKNDPTHLPSTPRPKAKTAGGLKPFEEKGIPGATVGVDEQGILIPPPPVTALEARGGLDRVRRQAAQGLAYLDEEIRRLRKAQSEAIAALQGQQPALPQGREGATFAALYALTRDPRIQQARADFTAAIRKAEEESQKTEAAAAALQAAVARAGQQELEDSRNTLLYGSPGTKLQAAPQFAWVAPKLRVSMSDMARAAYLADYRKGWEAYARSLDDYAARVTGVITGSETGFAPPTQMLIRLIKIQVFTLYQAAISSHLELWETMAMKGRSLPMPGDDRDASNH